MSSASTQFAATPSTPKGSNMNRIVALVIAKAVLGAGPALGCLAAPHGTAAHAAPAGVDVYAYEVGDDNGDGIIMEDESAWDCTTTSNRICGGGN
jgi:hypothetical protein